MQSQSLPLHYDVEHATPAPTRQRIDVVEVGNFEIGSDNNDASESVNTMDPTTTVCHELREIAKRRGSPDDYWVRPALLRQSLECGCEYCALACEAVGKWSAIEENKNQNRAAIRADTGLRSFEQGTSATSVSESRIVPHLTKSGITFQGDIGSREYFVLNRKYHSPLKCLH